MFHRAYSLDITNFDKNVLKINKEQTITGLWKLSKVLIAGDLNDVIINGLNLVKDILRYDVTDVTVMAPKTFRNVIVDQLNCTTCIVQGCNLNEWIRNAVTRTGENVIKGKVSVVTAEVEEVFTNNTINGLIFGPNTMLTKSTEQIFDTDLVILSTLDRKQRIEITGLDVNTLNGFDVDFLGNVATRGSANKRIESRINFIQPVVIGDLVCTGDVFGVNMTAMVAPDEQIEEKFIKLSGELDRYYSIAERIHYGYQGT